MTFPAEIGPRTQLAWDAILETLQDNNWHHHTELVQAARTHSDLADNTIDNLIRRGWRTRHYQRRTTRSADPKAWIYRIKSD